MSQQEWNNSNNPEDVGAGGEGQGEEHYSPKSRLRINASTLTLVACFAAAIAVLYLLGLQNKPRTASAVDVAREQNLETQFKAAMQNLNAADDQTQPGGKDAEKLTMYLNANRGSDEAMHDNPFGHDEPIVVASSENPTTRPTDNPPEVLKSVDPNLRNAAQEFNSLRLQMIVYGPHPNAMVSNLVLEPGTKLTYLVVDEITPAAVIFKYTEAPTGDPKETPAEHKWTLKAGPQK